MRHGRGWIIVAGIVAAVGMGGSAAAIPLIAIEGSTGVPGGSAAAVVSLADDDAGDVVSASVTIDYPDTQLTADPGDCVLAERLGSSHRLVASSSGAGMLILMVAPETGTPPLGNGALASCVFGIALGAPAGTAALELADTDVRDATGAPIEVATADGAIIIDAPAATPTVTNTPASTPTNTPPGPTDTPTATPTETPFEPTVFANRFGGCAVVPPDTGSALPLAGLALLILARRFRRH